MFTNGRLPNYDIWKSTEPDDSDVEYCDTWEEAEARAKRMVKNAGAMAEEDEAADDPCVDDGYGDY